MRRWLITILTGLNVCPVLAGPPLQPPGHWQEGLVTGDEVIMRLDEGYQLNAAENWKAQLAVTVKYL